MSTQNTDTLTTSEEAFVSDYPGNIDYVYHRVDKLDERDRDFARSLIKYYGTKGSLSPRQLPYMVRFWVQLKNQEAVNPTTQAVITDISWDASQLIALFAKAKEHLKFPKIRCVIEGTKYCCYLGVHTDVGRIKIKDDNTNTLCVTINPVDQSFRWKLSITNREKLALKHFFDSEDLVRKLAVQGQEYNHCCFCGLELTNTSSVYHGYGPICAGHYGLPWGDKEETKLSVSL